MDACCMMLDVACVSIGRLLGLVAARWCVTVFSLLCCGVSERSQPAVATPTGVFVTPRSGATSCAGLYREGVPVGRSPGTGAGSGTATVPVRTASL